MERNRILPVILVAAAIAAVCAAVQAQTAQASSGTQVKVRPVPEKAPPMPFPPGSETPGRVYALEFRSADQMTEKDRLLEADTESSIQERTTWAGMDFNGGNWSYKQLVCPALPNHLF